MPRFQNFPAPAPALEQPSRFFKGLYYSINSIKGEKINIQNTFAIAIAFTVTGFIDTYPLLSKCFITKC